MFFCLSDTYCLVVVLFRKKMHEYEVQIEIKRPLYDRNTFEKEYLIENNEKRALNWKKLFFKIILKIVRLFTVFSWLTDYKLKNQLIKDLISGCTVGIMHIPQGNAICNYSVAELKITQIEQK
jgi:hypothetical protein